MTSKHYEVRFEQDYIAKMREQDRQCEEVVYFKGQEIHHAVFWAGNLGGASRSEYLRCMVHSIAREHGGTAK